jgi:hypothetical protein
VWGRNPNNNAIFARVVPRKLWQSSHLADRIFWSSYFITAQKQRKKLKGEKSGLLKHKTKDSRSTQDTLTTIIKWSWWLDEIRAAAQKISRTEMGYSQ